jgi:hypothetical protein
MPDCWLEVGTYREGKSCDRTTGSRFTVVFLGSIANAELVPKFHVVLHASHAAIPILTSKLGPKVAPQINITFSPNAAHPKLITKFKITRECSKTQLNFSLRSTLHLTFSTSKCFNHTILPLPEGRAGIAWGPS